MNDSKKSKLDALRAKLADYSLDRSQTVAYKGGTLAQGCTWLGEPINEWDCSGVGGGIRSGGND